MTTAGREPCVPVHELQEFVEDQLVVLEGEDAITEEERARSSLVIGGMETSYLAGKMAMLKTVSDFVEEKRV